MPTYIYDSYAGVARRHSQRHVTVIESIRIVIPNVDIYITAPRDRPQPSEIFRNTPAL